MKNKTFAKIFGFTQHHFFSKNSSNKRGAGFTLIELLVVVAIIGLLSSVVLVSTRNARIKARDARRLSDLQQVKSGLDLFFNFGAGYPSTTDWNTAQTSLAVLKCGTQDIFKVPQDPSFLTDPTFTYTYTQGPISSTGCGTTVYTSYKIQFKTETTTSIGPAGTYYFSPLGITSTEPF